MQINLLCVCQGVSTLVGVVVGRSCQEAGNDPAPLHYSTAFVVFPLHSVYIPMTVFALLQYLMPL